MSPQARGTVSIAPPQNAATPPRKRLRVTGEKVGHEEQRPSSSSAAHSRVGATYAGVRSCLKRRAHVEELECRLLNNDCPAHAASVWHGYAAEPCYLPRTISPALAATCQCSECSKKRPSSLETLALEVVDMDIDTLERERRKRLVLKLVHLVFWKMRKTLAADKQVGILYGLCANLVDTLPSADRSAKWDELFTKRPLWCCSSKKAKDMRRFAVEFLRQVPHDFDNWRGRAEPAVKNWLSDIKRSAWIPFKETQKKKK